MSKCKICRKKIPNSYHGFCNDECAAIHQRLKLEKMEKELDDPKSQDEIDYFDSLSEEEQDEYLLNQVENEDDELIDYLYESLK